MLRAKKNRINSYHFSAKVDLNGNIVPANRSNLPLLVHMFKASLLAQHLKGMIMKQVQQVFFGVVALVLTLQSQAQSAINWNEVNVNTTERLLTVDFPDNQTGYIGGENQTLLKTTDGGENWSAVAFSGINFLAGGLHFMDLQFIDANIGFAAIGPYGGVYKTTNGGTTWVLVDGGQSQCYYESVFFFDENNGFSGGAGCFYGESLNQLSNGTWGMPQGFGTPGNTTGITAFDFYNANYGLAVSRAGYILKTIDGGQNWDTLSVPLYGDELTDVIIINDTLAYATYTGVFGNYEGALITEDAGVSWINDQDLASFASPQLEALHTSGDGTLFIGGTSSWPNAGLVYHRATLNDWWVSEQVNQHVYDVKSHSDSIVFLVGDSGFVATNAPFAVGINDLKTSNEFTVYPNPFTDILTIEMAAESLFTNLRLYSVAGRLVHEERLEQQGNTTVLLPELQRGTYLLELSDGEHAVYQQLIRK